MFLFLFCVCVCVCGGGGGSSEWIRVYELVYEFVYVSLHCDALTCNQVKFRCYLLLYAVFMISN